jgi:hypothetical protein
MCLSRPSRRRDVGHYRSGYLGVLMHSSAADSLVRGSGSSTSQSRPVASKRADLIVHFSARKLTSFALMIFWNSSLPWGTSSAPEDSSLGRDCGYLKEMAMRIIQKDGFLSICAHFPIRYLWSLSRLKANRNPMRNGVDETDCT